MHNHLSEFFLLDVVLKRARSLQGEGVACLAERDPDAVALASAYNDRILRIEKMTSTVLSLPFFLGLVSFTAIVRDGNRRLALRIHLCRWTRAGYDSLGRQVNRQLDGTKCCFVLVAT